MMPLAGLWKHIWCLSQAGWHRCAGMACWSAGHAVWLLLSYVPGSIQAACICGFLSLAIYRLCLLVARV